MRFAMIGLVCAAMFSSAALGGPLVTDPNAWTNGGTTWHGSTVMTSPGHNAAGKYLQATIDWAVYAPGQFPYSGPNFTPVAGQFTYAYQVHVTANDAQYVELTHLSVGMLESNEANNLGFVTIDSGNFAPTTMAFGGVAPVLDTANWRWAIPIPDSELVTGMLPGQESSILAYSSINAPLWMYVGSIQDSGLGAMGFLPSPSDEIPEPASLGLLLVGAVAMLRRKR